MNTKSIGGLRMQDRFRYRVWDKNQNKWLYFDFSTYPTYQDRIWQALTDGETFYQCTGLKDKDGKLIYEGDILKTKEHNLCKEGELFKVFCQETLCQFLGKSLTTNNCIDLCDLYEDEVVGNIYENPELLED